MATMTDEYVDYYAPDAVYTADWKLFSRMIDFLNKCEDPEGFAFSISSEVHSETKRLLAEAKRLGEWHSNATK